MSTDETVERLGFYGFTYVPFATVNGKSAGNNFSAYSITDSKIQTAYQQDPVFDFSVVGAITGTSPRTCDITVTLTALSDYISTQDITLITCIIENDINYQTVYGSAALNGKNDYSHVVRKFLSNTGGTVIGNQSAGDETTNTFAYTNDEQYQDYENLRVLTFVQDMATKEIVGAYQSDVHPFQNPTTINGKNVANEVSTMTVAVVNRNEIILNTKSAGEVTLSFYSPDGRMVRQIPEQFCEAGRNVIAMIDKFLETGCFILSVGSGEKSVLKRILLIK